MIKNKTNDRKEITFRALRRSRIGGLGKGGVERGDVGRTITNIKYSLTPEDSVAIPYTFVLTKIQMWQDYLLELGTHYETKIDDSLC